MVELYDTSKQVAYSTIVRQFKDIQSRKLYAVIYVA